MDTNISLAEIERSIIKKYRKELWSKFTKANRNYQLVNNGDRIAVAISGGKDSLLMAKLFQLMQRYGNIEFELEFLAMDPGFNEANRQALIDNCEYLGIPVKIKNTDIFKVADKIANDNPCYMCAKMRRGALYNFTQELNCNKLALGHHFNDVIETTMLNIIYTGCFKTMLPKLKSTNFKNIELIRPMYLIEERSIIKFSKNAGLNPLDCACRVTAEKLSSKRREVKELINNLNSMYVNADKNIFQAANNINADCVLGYYKDGNYISFLDEF